MRLTVISDFVVKMWTGGFSGGADFGNEIAALYFLSHLYMISVEMGISGEITVSMIDIHTITIAAFPSCRFYHSVGCGINLRASVGCKMKPGMETAGSIYGVAAITIA